MVSIVLQADWMTGNVEIEMTWVHIDHFKLAFTENECLKISKVKLSGNAIYSSEIDEDY